MTVLLDESVPRLVQERLPQLAIRTVQEMGWNGLKNGDLLKRAESQFDVFITADKKLRYQQNLSNTRLAIHCSPQQPSEDCGGASLYHRANNSNESGRDRF